MFGTPSEFNFQEGVPAAEFSFVGADSGSAEYRKRAVEAAMGMAPPQSRSTPVPGQPLPYFQPAPDVFSGFGGGFGAPPQGVMVRAPQRPRIGIVGALALGAAAMGLYAAYKRGR